MRVPEAYRQKITVLFLAEALGFKTPAECAEMCGFTADGWEQQKAMVLEAMEGWKIRYTCSLCDKEFWSGGIGLRVPDGADELLTITSSMEGFQHLCTRCSVSLFQTFRDFEQVQAMGAEPESEDT